MKKYEFLVTVYEGNDEFWESLEGKTGCDEVQEVVEDSLYPLLMGDGEVRLVKYTNELTDIERKLRGE